MSKNTNICNNSQTFGLQSAKRAAVCYYNAKCHSITGQENTPRHIRPAYVSFDLCLAALWCA